MKNLSSPGNFVQLRKGSEFTEVPPAVTGQKSYVRENHRPRGRSGSVYAARFPVGFRRPEDGCPRALRQSRIPHGERFPLAPVYDGSVEPAIGRHRCASCRRQHIGQSRRRPARGFQQFDRPEPTQRIPEHVATGIAGGPCRDPAHASIQRGGEPPGALYQPFGAGSRSPCPCREPFGAVFIRARCVALGAGVVHIHFLDAGRVAQVVLRS